MQMLTFEPFRIWYDRQKKKKTDMYTECGFAPGTVAKIFSDGFPVRSDVIETICRVYGLRVEQVIEYREEAQSEIS
jgi:DNA-binding Xre family transcriptional regulator